MLDLFRLMKNNKKHKDTVDESQRQKSPAHEKPIERVKEIGGPKGPEPTRYGDWEKRGRCIDF